MFFKPVATAKMIQGDFSQLMIDKMQSINAEPFVENPIIETSRKNGFDYTPTALAYVEKKRQSIINSNFLKWYEYYAQRYPQNRFITEEILKQLCNKYGLFHGKPGLYIKDIPEKNMIEMANFKCSTEDLLLSRSGYPHTESAFSIVASLDDFVKQDNIKIVADYRLVKDDPIILYSVNGGYLCVTAWGPEAKETVTPQRN